MKLQTGSKKTRGIYALLALTLWISLAPLKVLAIDAEFAGSNDILFYNRTTCDPVTEDDGADSGVVGSGDASGGNTEDGADVGSGGGGETNIVEGKDKLDGYTLPAKSGKTGYEDAMDSSGKLVTTRETVTFHALAKTLSKDYRDYYIAMRWNWTSWYWNVTNGSYNTGLDNAQHKWMRSKPRMILVTNKRNKKSVYVTALESGPAPWTGAKGNKKISTGHYGGATANGWSNTKAIKGTPSKYTGRVSGLSPKAIKAIDAKQGMSNGDGDTLTYQWASNQKAKPGPTTLKPKTTTTKTTSIPLAETNDGYTGKAFSNTTAIPLENSTVLKNMFQILLDNGFNAVQAAAIMGNYYVESGFKSDYTSDGGYGLAQWNVERLARLKAFAANKKSAISDVPTQISFTANEYKNQSNTYTNDLENRGFATTVDVGKATSDWMELYQDLPRSKWPDETTKIKTRIDAANQIYGWFNAQVPGTASDYSNCSSEANVEEGSDSDSGNDSGDSNPDTGGDSKPDKGGNTTPDTGSKTLANQIVAVALSYARKKPVSNGENRASDAEPAYIKALKKYNSSNAGHPADCGIYVATVMRATGDKGYPGAGTWLQKDYVESHPKLYKVIKNFKKSDLKPGDVIIAYKSGGTHHTQIYVGSMGGKYPAVDASQDTRVPGVKKTVDSRIIGKSYGVIARRKK
ncbi:hypothetical protein HGB25_00450 [Candidatus Saccharibacteria bacterium]|nr:hypothetical protein [Candidatus Saccharibacteria bacterium]